MDYEPARDLPRLAGESGRGQPASKRQDYERRLAEAYRLSNTRSRERDDGSEAPTPRSDSTSSDTPAGSVHDRLRQAYRRGREKRSPDQDNAQREREDR